MTLADIIVWSTLICMAVVSLLAYLIPGKDEQ